MAVTVVISWTVVNPAVAIGWPEIAAVCCIPCKTRWLRVYIPVVVTQTSQVTEWTKKAVVTLLVIGAVVWVQLQLSTFMRVARRTQQDLESIAIAAQKFYQQHNRWPRDLLEMRNDRSNPFIGQRDHWRRGYVFRPPSNGKMGRVETYGEDGIAAGRKDDGDAAVEFDVRDIVIVPLSPQ